MTSRLNARLDGFDLRAVAPRSVHVKYHGIVMLARATDKARAAAFGCLGEYKYNCPMDRAVFKFLGIDGNDYLQVVRDANSLAAIDAYVLAFVARKSADEISTWNHNFINYVPPHDSESWANLVTLRNKWAPGREDIVNWADVLDLDEGRYVPRRASIANI